MEHKKIQAKTQEEEVHELLKMLKEAYKVETDF